MRQPISPGLHCRRIAAFDPHLPDEHPGWHNAQRLALDELFAASDAVWDLLAARRVSRLSRCGGPAQLAR
jgi:hypothetical protein